MIDTNSKPYKIDDVFHILEEQLELFFSKDFETISKKPEKKGV